jgi:hypothetical protein
MFNKASNRHNEDKNFWNKKRNEDEKRKIQEGKKAFEK